MNPSLVVSIKESMEKKSTEELKKIYTKHNESWRSPEAFAAIYQVLTEREETVTPYAPDYEKIIPQPTQNAEIAPTLSSHTPVVQTALYTSTYLTARAIATLIAAIGWIVVAISILLLVVAIFEDGRTRMVLFPFLGSTLGGLLLVGIGQLTRATIDTADYTGEILAIMKATRPPKE